MNFCCHDDYTNTGSFDINDINIYSAYQSWVFQEKPTASEDDLDKSELVQFKNWYASKNALGQLPNLSKEIATLPKMDCGDFTETGSFDINDINIYSAHQSWVFQERPLASEDDSDSNECVQFKNWYASKNALSQLPNLSKEIKHLPSLETDSVVHTIDGDVAKGGEGFSAKIVSTEQAESDENLSENDLLISLDCTSAVHLNDTSEASNIKAVEIVFDNVEFLGEGDQNGLSYLEGGLDEVAFDEIFEDTKNEATLDYYYDYSIRTTGTEPRNNRSVIGFIDTTPNGNGENKITLGKIKLKVNSQNYSIIEEISPEIQVADIRIWDETTEVERYELVSCGSSTSGDE